MNPPSPAVSIEPPPLKIDPLTTLWLLERPHPAPDFFYRGVIALRPRAEQDVLGRLIAEGEFQSGADRYGVVAILGQPYDGGVHRLLDVAFRRQADAWPTLETGWSLDAARAAA